MSKIERLELEIETLEKAFRLHKKAYKRAQKPGHENDLAYAKEQYDYYEGIVEGLGTALKIMQGKIS